MKKSSFLLLLLLFLIIAIFSLLKLCNSYAPKTSVQENWIEKTDSVKASAIITCERGYKNHKEFYTVKIVNDTVKIHYKDVIFSDSPDIVIDLVIIKGNIVSGNQKEPVAIKLRDNIVVVESDTLDLNTISRRQKNDLVGVFQDVANKVDKDVLRLEPLDDIF